MENLKDITIIIFKIIFVIVFELGILIPVWFLTSIVAIFYGVAFDEDWTDILFYMAFDKLVQFRDNVINL